MIGRGDLERIAQDRRARVRRRPQTDGLRAEIDRTVVFVVRDVVQCDVDRHGVRYSSSFFEQNTAGDLDQALTTGRPCLRHGLHAHYIVAPSTQGANSAPPKSKLSLLVGCPDAVLRMRSKMRWPHCWTLSSPSRMVPQLTSMSSSMRLYMGVLVASLIEGAGLQPNTLPRPVVKQTRLAPPATCPVAATGS